MPRGLQLAFIAIGLVVIVLLLVYIWRQSRLLNEERLRQKKAAEFQAKRKEEMIESIRIIAAAVGEEQVEYSEACLRLKGLLDYVAPELLSQEPYNVFQLVHEKLEHMPTHRARKAADTEMVQQMDVERFAVEKEYAERIRQAASALRHERFE
ncbi:DUF2489 domain-containing protein [Marinobacter litoralis]|uniref:DUF2489 domain-containing protein n=1 Tax=Marinobacter litoralis TaxID=187981 RepID=UPI0018EACD20|nr:DUF2489 domain-containing protein [Marinobacter litoralis]MBJ6135921.1 DUF2489 domain-containing protein [Marinobacter litoralis]